MKFSISRNELLPSLQIVNGVVERRQTLPILSNLLLAVSNDSMSLTATDMEVELVSSITGAFNTSGKVTIPARKLLDICRALPADAEINIDIKDDRAQLTSGKSRFTLATLPAQEYPIVEIGDKTAEFKISQGELKDLLDQTGFAMAQQDVRYYLNGLLLEIGEGRLRAVATDGHRLALCDTEVSCDTKHSIQVIVPRKGVTELTRLLKESEDEIEVAITTNHVRIDIGGVRFTSKLIDGKFPEYAKVIPAENNSPITADREMLRQSLTRASILSNEKYRGIRIILEPGRLRALAHNPEQEEAEEEIEVGYKGRELEIGFNVSYLLDALGIIKTDEVELTISDPNSSCLLLPSGAANCKFVVMPMRL